MSVITEDGSFYAFNVKYAKEPDMLNIEMKDFIHDGSAVNRPNRSTFGRLQGKNFVMNVGGNSSERTVWTMDKFTLPDDKCLVVELAEKNGGRHQSFTIENTDLVRARVIWLRLPPSRLGHSSELDGSRCSVGSELKVSDQ